MIQQTNRPVSSTNYFIIECSFRIAVKSLKSLDCCHLFSQENRGREEPRWSEKEWKVAYDGVKDAENVNSLLDENIKQWAAGVSLLGTSSTVGNGAGVDEDITGMTEVNLGLVGSEIVDLLKEYG